MSEIFNLPSEHDLNELSENSESIYALRSALRVLPLLAELDNPPDEYKQAVLNLHALLENTFRLRGTTDGLNLSVVVRALRESVRQFKDFKNSTKNVWVDQAIRSLEAAQGAINSDWYFKMPKNSVFITDRYSIEAAFYSTLATSNAGTDETRNVDTTRAEYATFSDLKKLKELADHEVDASEVGLLGDLWNGFPPSWYDKARENYNSTIAEWEGERSEGLFDSDEECSSFDLELLLPKGSGKSIAIECVNVLAAIIDDLHKAEGGSGVKIDFLEIHENSGVLEPLTPEV